MTTKKKLCPKCKIEKKVTKFGERSYTVKSGEVRTTSDAYCKECRVKMANEWKANNREKFLAYQSNYKKDKKVVA